MDSSSSPVLSIRKAQPDDLIQLLRIQIDALRTLCARDYPPDHIEALIDRNIRHSSRGGYQAELTLVAEVNQDMVGLASLLGHRISAVYVHPQFAHQGIGSRLLHTLEHIAVRRNIRRLSVAASLTAQPFYLKHGYSVLGESALEADDGFRIRCINMQKSLTPAVEGRR